jgi:hypothetical protein
MHLTPSATHTHTTHTYAHTQISLTRKAPAATASQIERAGCPQGAAGP